MGKKKKQDTSTQAGKKALQKSLLEKSIALDALKRELNIEASLEKVRSAALVMMQPADMTKVCRIIAGELDRLGITDIRNVQTAVFNKEKGTYINHEYYSRHEKELVTEVDYTADEMTASFAKQMMTGPEEIFTRSLTGTALKKWYAFQQTTPQFADSYLAEASSLNYYWFSLGPIALGVSTYEPLHEQEIQVFNRFRNVFQLAYRRFLDIEQAAAQAREAKIEAALERTRTQSMIMQHSKELDDTLRVFHEQVLLLGIHSAFSFLWLPDEDKDRHIFWAAWAENNSTVVKSKAINYPLDRNEPATAQCLIDWKSNEPVFSYAVPPEGVENYFAAWKELIAGVEQLTPEHFAGGLYYVEAFMKYGCFGVMTATDLTEDEKKILGRFAIEFERAYTRFLDLQKAEAQAREAQIEAALEKVRSRSLAMHKSEEIKEVVVTVMEKMNELNIEMNGGVSLVTFIEGSQDLLHWYVNPEHVDGPLTMQLHYFDNLIFNDFVAARNDGKDMLPVVYSFEEKNKYFEYAFEHSEFNKASEEFKKWILQQPYFGYSVAIQKHSAIFFNDYTGKLFSEKDNGILKRFSRVFDQSYIRFLDLQKAEAQSKENQIQLALERVRARTMAMQRSNELPEAANILFQQMQTLGMPAWSAGYCIWDDGEQAITLWMSSAGIIQKPFRAPVTEDPSFIHFYDAWKRGETFYVEEIGGNAIVSHYQYMLQLPVVGEMLKQFIADGGSLPTFQIFHLAFFLQGFLLFITYEAVPEAHDIFKRFAKVFEQTYTRFLDLQKAEAQAKDAQIEAALERVRSRTMGMQKSEELKDIIQVVYEQFIHLNINIEHTGFIMDYKERDDMLIWLADKQAVPFQVTIPYFDSAHWNSFIEAKEKGKDFFANYLDFEEKNKFYQDLFTLIPGFPDEAKEYYFSCQGLAISTVLLDNVGLYIENFSGIPYSDEENNTLMRFGKVFQQTYTRFLDLQKAEAQAREAKIEGSLERVRSKTMAMHNSQDVADTVATLFDEVVKLGIETIRCGIGIMHDGGQMEVWTAKPNENGKADLIVGRMDMMMHPLLKGAYHSWQEKVEFYTYELLNDDLIAYFNAINNHPDYPIKYDTSTLPSRIIHSEFHFTEGTLFVFSLDILPAETAKIFKRFAGVFGQTYRRYLDLQKAEAQTREARIEAAMEKVRSRAMAMQKPTELVEVAQLLRKEMNALGVEELETSSIYILHEDTQKTECWYAIKDVEHPEKELVSDHMIIKLDETWVGRQMLAFYHSDKRQISITMHGANRTEWINYCADHSTVLVGFYGNAIPDRTYHLYKFSNGYIGAASAGDISAESWDLLQRATSVFSLAYTRFSDLQQAEAQAREARIEVSLERVRSRTLAMQKSDELAETAAVVFRQLIALGIEPNRLYITVIKDESGDMEFWITDEDGTRVGNKFSGNAYQNISFQKMYEGWVAHKKSIVIDMQGDELVNYFQHLNELGVPFKLGLTQKRRIQNIAYFGKGFIGMASPDEQPEETVNLLERFAAVFNLTYTRFNDLQVAEAHAVQAEEDLIKLQTEKKRAEDAFTELRETQKQLVQSEKMASLGELTAGIAHEIQNPLNFVNNFSEINTELIDELQQEAGKGNMDEVQAIAKDIRENEEKINHHGKRADSIVKGMLQHSRSSSGKKEPTDINVLVDEYLRLAYHGLRAKDKSFNATLNTDYDETIGVINIIPQDMGRVILNLITNAFYAVNERKKLLADSYEPIVRVMTTRLVDKIEIKVEDNGNGIPQKIIDKIFQPFFTTKPTGQGTGLGLSLAYDIVKAHGGELKVDTKDGEGATFIIQLPIT
jgi:signal transduction histidine kinase